MSSTPIIRQIAWLNFLPQVIYIALFFALFYWQGIKSPFIPAVLIWFALASALQNLVPREHRRGIALVKRGYFDPAIEHFENSYHFFTRNKWLDIYRSILLLSINRISYREMALLNIAYCYGQLGEGELSKEYYERTLQEFPDSGMAKAGLNMLNSANNNTE